MKFQRIIFLFIFIIYSLPGEAAFEALKLKAIKLVNPEMGCLIELVQSVEKYGKMVAELQQPKSLSGLRDNLYFRFAAMEKWEIADCPASVSAALISEKQLCKQLADLFENKIRYGVLSLVTNDELMQKVSELDKASANFRELLAAATAKALIPDEANEKK